MKRLILGFSLIFCTLMISVLSAQEKALNNAPASVLKQNEISKTQAEFLFGTSNLNNLNVEILSQKELEEAKGEFWPMFLFGLGVTHMGVANAPGLYGPTYSSPWQQGVFWR